MFNLIVIKCSICLDQLKSNDPEDTEFISLWCGHSFHRYCIKEWLRISKKCPLCRQLSNVCKICKQRPDDLELDMLCCRQCGKWNHFFCIGLVGRPKKKKNWICYECDRKLVVEAYKRKMNMKREVDESDSD